MNLSQIISIINGYVNAKDSERVFTYIEFVKMFGFENNPDTFISIYKEYVTRWANIKKSSIDVSIDDYVMSKMVEILKSITLDYSSYQEQDFIAHINLYNKSHLKALSTLFSRKIKQITNFYRKKRNEAVTVIRKNSMRGSKKSIEQIIYEKVFDFVFSNRNILPSYKNIKRDLLVSVENYVDTYSEYFDIPRQKEFTDKTRAQMLSANMNDVDYRMYLEIELVMSEILFSGNVYLEEIPLVAQIGVDLSQSCVGDMLALKNNLMANTQINQVDLTEQIALKRKLYEKFLGCDLWYMYVDLQGNITMDVLCKAKNPTGNLLNCGTADTATIENENLKLLSHIGLFFKPDKTSILKVNAKDYTWTVDLDVIENDTMYVFPDPTKYGDIGNNKQGLYPLIMQYKLDKDIRNLSSGYAAGDPMKLITDQGWYSYYTKQDEDFRYTKNSDYQYIFTWLANQGFIANYQQDIWGNYFGILKGFDVNHTPDPLTGKITIEVEQDYIESSIKTNSATIKGKGLILNGGYFENPLYKGRKLEITVQNTDKLATSVGKKDANYHYRDRQDKVPFRLKRVHENFTDANNNTIKNLVYRRDLTVDEITDVDTDCQWKDVEITLDDQGTVDKKDDIIKVDVAYCCQSTVRNIVSMEEVQAAGLDWEKYYEPYIIKKYIWVDEESYNENAAIPFDYDRVLTINDYYNWSGIKINNSKFFYHTRQNFINFGTFDKHLRWSNENYYVDNFRQMNQKYEQMDDMKDVITDVVLDFITQDVYTNGQFNIVKKKSTFDEIQKRPGQFYVKLINDIHSRPQKLQSVFNWVDWEKLGKPSNFFIVKQVLIVETDNYYAFIPYSFDGNRIINTLGVRELFKINKKWSVDWKKSNQNGYTPLKNEIVCSKTLFVESSNKIYILVIQIISDSSKHKSYVIPTIYTFDVNSYKIEEIINLANLAYASQIEENELGKEKLFHNFTKKKMQIVEKDNWRKLIKLIDDTTDQDVSNINNLELPYYPEKYTFEDVSFSYNSLLGSFLISYINIDNNGTPYIFEHKFKCDTIEYFLGSLITSMYTIKNVLNENDEIIDINYSYNDKLTNPSISVSTPDVNNISSLIFKIDGEVTDDDENEDDGGDDGEDDDFVTIYDISEANGNTQVTGEWYKNIAAPAGLKIVRVLDEVAYDK